MTSSPPTASGERDEGSVDRFDTKREAEMLLMHVLKKDRAWVYAHASDSVDQVSAGTFLSLVDRRKTGEPIAYLLGNREFWSLDLTVNPAVLIPRAETELLVELALQRIPQHKKVEIADLGTGSGAIAIAIARERPHSHVLAIDSSAQALDVARDNAVRNGVTNIDFAIGDWFAALGSRRFDVIVSNPPYIAENDPHLTTGDLRFEPADALASGRDGLDAIRIIIREAPAHLASPGYLLLEHGYEQGGAVRKLLEQNGFTEVFTALDLERRERVSGGVRGA
jgi:release factor glutamine methyltransferase